ncbi:MAG TPA: hypothetical protein VH682_06310 [Gemmataceae bacterium]
MADPTAPDVLPIPAGRTAAPAKVMSHAKYLVFQLAEVAVPRPLFVR